MHSHKPVSEYRVILTSFLVDLLDVVMNLSIALFTGSVVMLAEFFQGLTDLTATGLLLVGHVRSKKRADKHHPFGHGKEIYFWTLISAVIMMTLTATISTYLGISRLLNPEHIEHIWVGLVALLLGLITNGYALSLSSKRLLKGKNFRQLPYVFLQEAAVATKNAFVLDLMGTTAALFGLISLCLYLATGERWFDSFGAVIIGITTAVLAYILITGVKGFLIGKRAPIDVEEKIKDAAKEIKEVKEVLDLRTMYVGTDKLLVNIEVHMKDNLTTDELEVLTDEIKKHIRSKVTSIQHIQVELETPSHHN